MTTSSRLAAILAIVATLGATTAHADPTPADLESARELYRDGKELRQKGDLRGALERFKAAHGYGQTPVTGLELGRAHMQLGELVEAREVFLSIARLKVASDETDKSAQARAEAAELAEQVRGRIPTVIVKVSGSPPNAEPAVTIDGVNVPVVSLSSIRKVNPGEHTVAVRVGTHEEKRSVTVSEGESKDVSVDFAGVSSDPQPSVRRIHPLTYAGAGLAAAGLVVGTVGGVLALGKASSVDDACNGLSCPPSVKSDVDDGRTFATVSTIGFTATAAGLALAAIGLFVLKPKSAGALGGRFVF
jgi:hypothetical protein